MTILVTVNVLTLFIVIIVVLVNSIVLPIWYLIPHVS